jgi:hypothetical protein
MFLTFIGTIAAFEKKQFKKCCCCQNLLVSESRILTDMHLRSDFLFFIKCMFYIFRVKLASPQSILLRHGKWARVDHDRQMIKNEK